MWPSARQPHIGLVGFNEHDNVVEGIVLLIKGKDANEVLKGVKDKIEFLNDPRTAARRQNHSLL